VGGGKVFYANALGLCERIEEAESWEEMCYAIAVGVCDRISL